MPIAEASKEVKEESNNKSAALEFICVDEMTDPSSIIRPLMSHCNSCGIGAIDQAFIQREWERDRQSDRLHWWRFYDPTADPPPPLQTEANLQPAQAQSVHCQDPRGLVRSPAALQSQATVTHSSPAVLLPHIYSPCPPSLSFPSSFLFCLSLKMHPRVLMLPIKDSHNSDTVTNKLRSELPSRLQLIPPAGSHQSQASWGEHWFQLSIH